MEKWAVEKSKIVNWDNHVDSYGGMLHDLGDGFKGLLGTGKCGKRNRAMVFGCEHVEESGPEFDRPRKRFLECGLEDDDDNEEEVRSSCVVLSDDSEEEGLNFSLEKQETLPGMLEWLTWVARCPHDTSIGVIPHSSKWNECWIQVTRAKKALLVQRDNAEFRYQNYPLLGHQTMHPSMYEDDCKSTGRLRYSLRLSKPHSSSCRELIADCESTTPERTRTDIIAGTTTNLVAGTSRGTDLQVYSNAITKPNNLEIPRRYVALGRHFQARVDEWRGSGLDSDTKWLGTRIWPLENKEALDRTLGNDLIGKGRPDCCSCDIHTSGSVECIRFHIAEKRMELKRDLGDAFFHWRFNQMGEEVSLRWTETEEERFKKMMISNSQSFWENGAKCFRGKKREQLVSYYFNVFLINRRRYQNRVTPRNIDSDDEQAFGSVGNSFGRDAVTLIGSDIMICSQNSQCNDFD